MLIFFPSKDSLYLFFTLSCCSADLSKTLAIIISLFILFKSLTSNGIFVVEELEFPNIRDDMNIYNEKPAFKASL